MTHEEDRLPHRFQGRLQDYNAPPALSQADLDDMWSEVERETFAKRRFTSPSAEPRRAESWTMAGRIGALAAMLLIGVAIGRWTARQPRSTAGMTVASAASPQDTVTLPEPYQSTTSRYLGQTVDLLVSLPSEVRAGRANERFLGRAHDLLLTTRLLLDSPAASDPRFRTLLDDLELVLAQVVRLQSDQSREELDLIRQALEQRDVLPRLRTAAADISADD